MEFTSLVEGVPAGGGIDHNESFVRSGFVLLANGAFDLGELVHEIVSRVESTRRVAEEEVVVSADRFLVRLIADGGRVCFVSSGDDGEVEPLTPADELLDGSGAESVGRGHENGVALAFKEVAEFGSGGGFTCAIHPDDEDDCGFAIGAGCEGRGVGRKEIGDFTPCGLDNIFGGNFSPQISQIIDDFKRKPDAEVARDEVCFEIIPIDLGLVCDLVEELLKESCHGGRMLGQRRRKSQGILFNPKESFMPSDHLHFVMLPAKNFLDAPVVQRIEQGFPKP